MELQNNNIKDIILPIPALPIDIWKEIIKYLDIKSIHNLTRV
jgi:hypothetical protein